jgi:hypothetical protein
LRYHRYVGAGAPVAAAVNVICESLAAAALTGCNVKTGAEFPGGVTVMDVVVECVAPTLSVTVSTALNVPAFEYV